MIGRVRLSIFGTSVGGMLMKLSSDHGVSTLGSECLKNISCASSLSKSYSNVIGLSGVLIVAYNSLYSGPRPLKTLMKSSSLLTGEPL